MKKFLYILPAVLICMLYALLTALAGGVAQRLLMEAMVACGNRAQAVQHYRSFERLLADELSVRPMRETRDLAAAIARVSAAPEPDATIRAEVPYRQTLLMARQQLAESLSLLDQALSQ